MRVGTPLMLAAVAFVASCNVAVAGESRVQIGDVNSTPRPSTYDGWSGPIYVSTYVEIRPTDQPNAIAEIYYQNAEVNDSVTDDGRYQIELDGIVVEVYFDHDHPSPGKNGSQDLVTILPPDGVVCFPTCDMLLDESDEMVIYLMTGVGM